MKFGKLADISQVDFTLPADAPGNADRLQQLPGREGPPRVYIGCTGWSMKEWVGSVYPKGTKSAEYLRAYAKQFNTIELNTTHYRIPGRDMIDRWYAESAEDFRFCPKVPQSISHSKSLGLGTDLIPTFCDAVAGLEEKLGCCFIQLPPYFGHSRLPQLRTFLEAFPSHIPLAVEVRHESWYQEAQATEDLLQLLHQHRRAAVLTDVAGRRDVLHMGLSDTVTMVRFVGNGLHETDYERAKDWIRRLKQWSGAGVKDVYFFPHQPDNVRAPQMAEFLCEQLAEHWPEAESRGPVPDDASNRQGDQMSLF